jgi:hypothetical protein
MKAFKYITVAVVVLVILCVSYLGFALNSAIWYENIDMDTEYSVRHYLEKIDEIVDKFAGEPLEVTTFSISEKECEGILKQALRINNDIAASIHGLGLTIQQKSIIIKTNLQIASLKKSLEITIKPYAEEKERELTLKVEKIKLGEYPLPVSPILYIVEKTIPEEVPITIANGRVRLNINKMPVALKYVRIESQQLVAGLSVATAELTNMSKDDKVLIQEVFTKAEVLNTGLNSTQLDDFITEMQQKDEILSADIDRAKAIYNSLSSEDKEILHNNLSKFMRDPAVNEALKSFGLK